MSNLKIERRKILFKILVRSLFLQALWNFERLQNIGFAYTLFPFFKKLFPDYESRKEVILRHESFFNTHPYMSGIIFGIVASLEEEKSKGKEIKVEEIAAIKNNMAGPLAAIGDTFFWATWKPFIALISVSIILFYFNNNNFQGVYLSPFFFVAAYNIVHIPFRYWSLKTGYLQRNRIVEIIAALKFHYAVDIVRFLGVIILACTLIFYILTYAGNYSGKLVFFGVFLFTVLSGYLRLSPSIIFYFVSLLSILYIYLRG